MKKIIAFTSYFYPDMGGVANHTYNLYKRIAANRKFEVTVVASSKKDSVEEFDNLKVIRLNYWFKISNSPFNPLWVFRIRRIIKDINPDLIMIHIPVPILGDFAAFLSGRIPYVIKYHHGGSMVGGKFLIDPILKFYEKTLFRIICAKAKYIISASSFVADTFLKEYKNKLAVVTPGVDLKKFKKSKTDAKDTILFVASLSKPERARKGLRYLLHAIPLIKKKIPSIKLLVVGGGDDIDFFKNMARKLAIYENIKFFGPLGDERIRLYKDSNVFVLPSLNESCPNVILEAMATGKAIAATNTTGIPYLIENEKEGLLFTPKNSREIADKVVTILNNKKLAKRLAENAIKKVKKFYSWDKKVDETIQIINKILEHENYKKHSNLFSEFLNFKKMIFNYLQLSK